LSPEEIEKIREGVAGPYRRIYQDLAVEGRMTQAEADRIVEAVVDHFMLLSSTDFGEKADPVAAAALFHELNRDFHSQVAAEFGQPRDDALRKYQDSINARFEVDEMRHVLEAASLPLSDTQRSRMIKAAIDAGAYIPMPYWTGAESSLALGQEMFERVKQRDQKILSLARGVLTLDQHRIYEAHISQRHADFEAWLRRQSSHEKP
jgi:hypothetical protein